MIKETKSRKLLAFDLKQDALKEYYPKPKFTVNPQYYKKAYKEIELFFKGENWEHKQGSGYISNVYLSDADVIDMIDKMIRKMPWLGDCIGKCDIGNITDIYDLRISISTISKQVKSESINKAKAPKRVNI